MSLKFEEEENLTLSAAAEAVAYTDDKDENSSSINNNVLNSLFFAEAVEASRRTSIARGSSF